MTSNCPVCDAAPTSITVYPVLNPIIPGQPQTHSEWAQDHHPNGSPRYVTHQIVAYACGHEAKRHEAKQ